MYREMGFILKGFDTIMEKIEYDRLVNRVNRNIRDIINKVDAVNFRGRSCPASAVPILVGVAKLNGYSEEDIVTIAAMGYGNNIDLGELAPAPIQLVNQA